MSVILGTDAGARVAIDTELDSAVDRRVALDRHLASVTAWTVNTGSIVALRDGAEALEIEVEVTGSYTGEVEILAAGRVLAASKPVNVPVNARARVLFRLARAPERDAALAAS